MPDAGALQIQEAEIDFGSTGSIESPFNVSTNLVSTQSKILCGLALKSPSDGRDIDEIRWEQEAMTILGQPQNGSIDFYIKDHFNGGFLGKFVLWYLVT